MSQPPLAPLSPRWLRLLLLPGTLLVFGALALLSTQPPSPKPAEAPSGDFSAVRAIGHLSWLAAEPHPLGSAAHIRVRERLVSELETLGLAVELQPADVVYDYARHPEVTRMASVTNVLARKPGTRGSGKTLALMAHYDSVPGAPGAADDGSGVIAILETLRALAHHPPLANDLLVVITDGEERGLLGAQAFVRQHPWVEEIGLVLNFEARGTRGPVFMFETSEGNAALIRALAEAAPHPFANSLSDAIYRRLPNDTDLSITKAAGIPGLNFAFNDGFYDYHTAMDRPERLSPASVQHAGSYALALTRYFGDTDLDALAGDPEADAPDATYFNTVGFHLVDYPMTWVPWLTAGTLVALVAVLGLALWWRGVLGEGMVRGLVRGLLAFFVQLGGSAALVVAGAAVIGRTAGTADTRFEAMLAHDRLLLIGFGLWIAGVALLVWHGAVRGLGFPGLRRPVPAVALSLGALTGWGLLLLAVTRLIPGAAYLLTWPLLAAVVAHAVVLLRARPGGASPETGGSLLILTAGSVPGVLWLVPYTALFFVALGVAQPALALAPAMLLGGLLVPAMAALEGTSRKLASGACLAAGTGLLLCAAVAAPFGELHPKPVELAVWHDADSGRVRWASPETEPDRWTRGILGAEPERRSLGELLPGAEGVLWTAPASAGSLWLPRLDPVDEGEVPAAATHRFRLRVPHGAETVALSFPDAAAIRSAWWNGRRVKVRRPADGWWRWWIFNLPAEGAAIGLELSDPATRLEARVAVFADRWPDPLAPRLAERPGDRMARPRGLGDSTVVTRTFELP